MCGDSMKEILITIFKLILTLFILILLVGLFQVSFNFFERLFINNESYYMVASPYSKIYGIIASLVITFLIFLLLFKDKSSDYIPYIFNKKVLPIILILLVFGYFYSLFKVNVIYDDYIKIYSLFETTGKEISFDKIDKINIKIKKDIYQSYKLYYTIEIEDKNIEIFNNANDFGLELERFDHISILNKKFKDNNIEIKKDKKNLEGFLESLTDKEKSKIKKIFN